MMECGISTACFYPQKTEDTFLELCKREIKNIEIFFNTFSEMDKDFIKEIKKQADFYGTKIVATHPFTCAFEPFLLFTEYERRFNDGLDLYKTYFEVMNILNSKIFVFHGDRYQSPLEDEAYYERFAKLRDIGKQYGVIVAQENVERCKSRNLNFLKNMITYLDDDVALVFDNKQAIRSKVSNEDFINNLGNNIIHVHISDHNKSCDCIPLGKGNLDINQLINKLNDFSFNGYLIVELYTEFMENMEEIYTSYNHLVKFI